MENFGLVKDFGGENWGFMGIFFYFGVISSLTHVLTHVQSELNTGLET